MTSKKSFVIVDAMALAYKAYFAFINRPLSNSKGEPTSAIFGFLTQLFKIIEDTKPDYIAIAFDSKEKTFRYEMYDKYKSSRSEMPEDMIPQIHKIKEIIDAFNMPLYILPRYEADDLIGTAVREAEKFGLISYAITPDKDYVQLVNKNTFLIKPGHSTDELEIIDEKKVLEKYGFEPKYMIDYLALVGDSSDDIPGVKGIGPKSATPLIQQFGTVENIYFNIDKIDKKGIKLKLENEKENALLSKKLATIITDAPFEIDLNEAIFKQPDFDKLLEIFKNLEFKNFSGKLLKLFNKNDSIEIEEETIDEKIFDKNKVRYKLITDETGARFLFNKLSQSSLFVFDTETDSLNTFQLNLAGCAFSVKAEEAFYVATNPGNTKGDLFARDLSDRLPIETFIEIFKPLFENAAIKKVCQNGKFDMAVLRKYGIKTENFYFDTMLASYILDPDQKHSMDELAKKYLHYSPIPISNLIGSKKSAEKIFDVDPVELSDYSCEDADITFRLYELFDKLLKEESLNKLAYEIEFPLAPVLEEMEFTGVKLDIAALKKTSDFLTKKIEEYTKNIFELSGNEFNINSTKQLQVILFDKLNLRKTKKTKTGYSTDAGSLESLKGEHAIIEQLLEYRQAAKLKSTYADALPKLIEPSTGRIHTSFNQTVASTGRLSSNSPNLQNIPIRTELGREIRKAFVPRNENYILMSADYSQIELRIMASICKDEALMSAFKNNEDIHSRTAALVFMVPLDEVTPDMRRKAKEVNFGILYGIGPFGLKNRLGITQQHAKEIIDTYFNTFKNVKHFMDESVEKAKLKGYAETLNGRRRYLKNINSSNRVVRQFEERVAINMPIQGTAADMIKIAMTNIHTMLQKSDTKTKMVLQVHDELVFDMHKDEKEVLAPIIKNLMESAIPLNVPIVAEIGFGKNWIEAH